METLSIGRKIRRRGFLTPRFFFGLILIFLGLSITLERSKIIDDRQELLQYWPVFLVLAGLSMLLWQDTSPGRILGFLLLGIGTWKLLETFDLVPAGILDFWPVLLVLLGLRMLWRGSAGSPGVFNDGDGHPAASASSASSASASSTVQAIAALGGATRRSNSTNFRGGDLVAVMGGCEIDLRQARIQGPPAVIDAFAFWGGVEIRVPEDWTVKVEGIALLGAYEDSTHARGNDMGPRQELIVRGVALMGGVEIKN